MTPDDIAQIRHHVDTHRATCANSCALIEQMIEEYEHALSAEGDHLSIASRRMVETVMGDREALRAEVRRMNIRLEQLADAMELAGHKHLADIARGHAKIQIRGWK